MSGRLSRVRYTSPTKAMAISPNAVPVRWRRMIIAMNPTIASVVMMMSSGVVSGKNMSKNESLAPSGRNPYFMSVMY